MSTYGIRGSSPFGPLTKFISQLVKEKLEAQWSTANGAPAKESGTDADKKDQAKIRFGLGWAGPGLGKQYEIHCLDVGTPSQPAENSWSGQERDARVDVHVFARMNQLAGQPAELLAMMNEVDRIITQHCNTLGQGVGPAKLVTWLPAHDPENYNDEPYWHWRGVHSIKYWTASTT